MHNMVLELQQELLQKDCDIVQVLRKAHVLALKNNLTEFDAWLQFELNGYSGHAKEIPPYRRITGNVKAKNPFGQWVPVIDKDGTRDETLSTRLLHHDLPTLAELYAKAGKNEVFFSYSVEMIKDTIDQDILGLPSDMALFIQASQIKGIIEAVKNHLLEWLIRVEKSGVENMEKKKQAKVLDLIDAVPEIRKAFKVTDIKGFPRTETIYSEPVFIEWSEEIKAELRKLKQDELIKEILELFDKFSGWTDKRLFETVAAKLKILKDNYDEYVAFEKSMEPSDSSTRAAQSITNIYFQGDISKSNISTGSNTEQEYTASSTEEKTWMEKYGFPLILALIGAAATIIAAIIAL